MGKRRREVEADNAMSSTAEYNTVFVDTSLDTHLAMLVSDSDTVLDFKRKLKQEHAKCFPNNGEIWFHSLKVKCKGNFYHLPDFMLVCSALHGVKGNWFLSADASGSLECYINQKASECCTKDPCGVISSDANKMLSLKMSLPDGVTEENKISGMIVGQKVEKYSDRTDEFWRDDAIENSLGTRSPAKKKRKMKYREAVLPSPTFDDHCSQFHASGEETPQPVSAGCKIDAGEETAKLMPGCTEETAEDVDLRYNPSNIECSGVVEGASLPATVKKSNLERRETPANFYVLDNREEYTMLKSEMPETLMIEKPQNELGRNAPIVPLEGDTNTDDIKQSKIYKRKKKKLPHGQMIENTLSSSDYLKEDKSLFSNSAEISGILEDGHCDNNSEAPCPLKGTGIKEPDTGHLALKVNNLNQCLEIEVEGKAPSSTNDVRINDGKDRETDRPDINDEQTVSSQNHDQALSQSEKIETLGQHEAHGNIVESVSTDHFSGANGEMGCGGSKMKAEKSGGKICNDADGELSENGMHLTPLTSRNLELTTLKHHETAKIDSILPTAETGPNLGSKEDRDLSENHQFYSNECELDVTTIEANSSAILVDANVALEGIKSHGKNRKKKRFLNAAAMLQDITDVELKTKKGETTGSHAKTSKSRKKEVKRELSMNQELEVILPSYNNTSAFADPVITPKIGSPSELLDKNFLEESEIAGNSRKKKAKKGADSNLGKSAVKQSGRKEMSQPDLVEEQGEMSLSHDPVSIELEKLGTSYWHEADGNVRESVQPNSFSHTEEEMGHGFKKKRMAKKSRGKTVDETDGEHSDNGIHLTPIAVPNLDLNFLNDPETKRTYSISPTAEADLDVGTKEDRNVLVSHELQVNQPEAGVAIIEPKLPYGLIHASGASDDAHYNHDRRKKKKSKKSVQKIQDTSDRENSAQKALGGDGLSHDFEVMLPSLSKVSGCTDPESKNNGVGFTTKFLDGNMVGELKTSRDHRRKQSVKKSTNKAMGNFDMEPANNGTSGSSAVLLSSATDHSREETDKGQNILFHKVKLDGSAADFERKVGSPTRNESGSMKLTQTLEDVGICEQRMEKKQHSSAGDFLSVLPAIEKGNQVNNLEPNRAQKSSEIAGIKDKKAKKKTKGHIASDCLKNIPIKDQEVTVEVYSTVGKAKKNFDFKQECQRVDSQVLSHKTEEKLEEIHHTADDLIRHVEDKDEGINFKHYFLPGQKQDKVAFVDKVKEATKSSEEVKTVKKVKKRGLPSVSTSIELHDSAKLSENKDGKNKSRVRCCTGRKDGDLIVSSKVSDSGVIDSSPTEMLGMTTRKKRKENTISSSFTKDKSMHLLARSGIFSGSGRNKRWQSGLNVSDKFVMKTPEKNSLFAKVGSLFQDSSGESSGDENGTKNSDASTCSPSDSSSQSGGCSAGESDLSQASARNGSNDAQGRTTREKNNAKFELSASDEVTMDMILRSSKRFKKAKLIASQNELELIDSQLEIVPDSQPNNE